ncbi:hypothetical protein ACTWPT_40980 [Nonomuraea sp. 3N208]
MSPSRPLFAAVMLTVVGLLDACGGGGTAGTAQGDSKLVYGARPFMNAFG